MAESISYPDFLTHYYEAARGPFRCISSIPSIISLTYGDSFPAMRYTLAELPELVRVYGLPLLDFL